MTFSKFWDSDWQRKISETLSLFSSFLSFFLFFVGCVGASSLKFLGPINEQCPLWKFFRSRRRRYGSWPKFWDRSTLNAQITQITHIYQWQIQDIIIHNFTGKLYMIALDFTLLCLLTLPFLHLHPLYLTNIFCNVPAQNQIFHINEAREKVDIPN